ncbi:ABC1 kinase family protein [Longimicrobium sp.]|uniref:ABC1 kinase family protein n=1 Tax=Longimicrobium sp. TaxID=2029185 RepID=UPI002E3501C1|nr:AarF/UbiB family protein [Longimicrobium sp.]HEX6042035.1 AarF/UbiB family protein [Longimicrobium sp.]
MLPPLPAPIPVVILPQPGETVERTATVAREGGFRPGGWTALVRAAALAVHLSAAALRFAGRRVVRRGEPRARVLGRTLAELFQALGPSYVKLGQLLSTRRDLLADDTLRPLARLRDKLPPGPFRIVPGLFRAELGVEVGDVFAALDPVPVASASIATVYRGRLRDGRVVAVKVRRPGVARVVRADLRLLRAGARLLSRLPPLRLVPVQATVEDFCAALERQLDLRREADASRRLRAVLACEPDVVVPALVDELCGESVLTMEFVDGMRPLDGRGGGEARHALTAAVRALYRMIFEEGCIHCDLHQGNLHYLPGGRAVVLDFGFVVEIGDEARRRFAQFFYAMATNDGERCARITRDIALAVPAGLDYRAFRAEVVALVEQAFRARAGEFRVAEFVGRMFDLQRRHGLRGSSDFVMPVLSLLVLEGMVLDVDPGLDFQREARPFVMRAAIPPYVPRPADTRFTDFAESR